MSYGVFRPRPDVYWWPRSRRVALRPTESPTRAQTGVAVGVAATTGRAAKVVAVGGTCVAVAAPVGQAVRVAPARGAAIATSVPTATERKVATPVGAIITVVSGTELHSRVSPEGGAAVGVAWSRSRVTSGKPAVGVAITLTALPISKKVGEAGLGVATAISAGKALRVARVGGVCASLAVSASKATRRAPVAGHAVASAVVTVRFAARVNGTGVAFGGTSGTASKGGMERGQCSGAAALTGRAARRAPQAGLKHGVSTTTGRAARRQPMVGQCGGIAVIRGFQVVVGPTIGTRVSPPRAIADGPIAGSRITWTATLDGGGLLVETSIDNGATWQPVESGQPIPRLVQGDNRTSRTVLIKVTMTRSSPDAPTPRLHRMELEIAVDSSREELCPLGVFTLNDVDVSDSARGVSIEISGADLARKVSRNRWDDTYIITEGTNYGTAIMDGIRNRMPDAVFNFASTDRTTPRLFFGEQASNDPWLDFQEMAIAIGHELFFDARGICTLRPEPDPEVVDPVHEFEDTAHPTIVELNRRVTDENTYNKVIATGEGSSNTAPVRGVAIDDDPSSPTYYLGPYGTVTDRFTSPLIITAEQAQDAANARLLRVKGATEAVELDVVPMPALEPGDVILVNRGRTKVEGRFILDQLRTPLGAEDPQRVVGRRQRV